MLVSRRLFESLALDFGRAFSECKNANQAVVVQDLMEGVCDTLLAENARFDRDKFVATVIDKSKRLNG